MVTGSKYTGVWTAYSKLLYGPLYSIHEPSSRNINFQIVPLVYTLMTKKSEELYPILL